MIKEEINRTILIVDDDISTNKLFQFYLKTEFNGNVLSAYNGIEAVEKCLRHQPELVIMDINMPYKDGIIATKDLRAAGYRKPILVVTVYVGNGMDKEYLNAGANVIIPKPVSRKIFLKQFRYFFKEFNSIAI